MLGEDGLDLDRRLSRDSLPLLSREAERREVPRRADPEGDLDLRLEIDLDLRLEVDLDLRLELGPLEVERDLLLEPGPLEVDLDLSLDLDLMMKVVASSPPRFLSVDFEPARDDLSETASTSTGFR